MQNKLWSIAKRECSIRMRKPAFWILSLLGPVILIAISVVPYALTSSLQESGQILVNVSDSISRHFPLSIGKYKVKTIDVSTEEAYVQFLSGEEQVLCDFFVGKDTVWTVYTKEVLHPLDSMNIVRTLSVISSAPASVGSHVVTIEASKEEQESSFSPLQQTVALGAAILIYFFLFTYSVSLLKGVMEEKSNKVMDLLLSSVSPSSWIMGKIAGVGIASFVQFMLWMLMSYVPFYFFEQRYGTALNSFSAA
ncbi:MAG TPA: ABC transporter permease, partial [Cytophagaceae bacterium]|nr:ABC transporter permease [Cytophagaceae bacterium]